jgi:hypothetical protein
MHVISLIHIELSFAKNMEIFIKHCVRNKICTGKRRKIWTEVQQIRRRRPAATTCGLAAAGDSGVRGTQPARRPRQTPRSTGDPAC